MTDQTFAYFGMEEINISFLSLNVVLFLIVEKISSIILIYMLFGMIENVKYVIALLASDGSFLPDCSIER